MYKITPVAFLDGKKLFEQYVALGKGASFQRLAGWCATEGMINPETGKKPTRYGLWWAMWLWVCKNKNEAKKLFDDFTLHRDGTLLSEKEWEEFLLPRVAVFCHREEHEIKKFKKEYGYTI